MQKIPCVIYSIYYYAVMSIPRLIVILGPTASGKSDLAVEIALKFGGEVVSADSRQVYKGLDIGTGKITSAEMHCVPHHLLDVADPREQYSVARYKRDAEEAIDVILSRGKLPILCGGTGFYIQAIVDNRLPPETPPDKALREELGRKTRRELFCLLQKIDPNRAKSVDSKNPRRLIRAIEIARHLGFVPEIPAVSSKYDTRKIGIRTDKEILRDSIAERLKNRFAEGMIEEAKRLHENGLSFERMDELGLEYRHLARHLQGNLSREDMEKELLPKIWQYAKRQIQWFQRDEQNKWLSLAEKPEIFAAVEDFLEKW